VRKPPKVVWNSVKLKIWTAAPIGPRSALPRNAAIEVLAAWIGRTPELPSCMYTPG
jgi:hypothetical protein